MILTVMVLSLLVSPIHLAYDCQSLCLGKCRWNLELKYCEDTRVVRLGTWDPIPLDYTAPSIYSFDVSNLPQPADFGTYPLERPAEIQRRWEIKHVIIEGIQ